MSGLTRLGLIPGEFFSGRVRRINLLVKSAAMLVKIDEAEKQQTSINTKIHIGTGKLAAPGSTSGFNLSAILKCRMKDFLLAMVM
ncbi:MAG TPA: hypothetical protein VHY30_05470 [Verrucomicrobiae bacterium]|jgi:hypothetical protein|nr:hypothetical protein [Verrucomicrobiae bacterium]